MRHARMDEEAGSAGERRLGGLTRALSGGLRYARRAALDLVYPPFCIACRGAVTEGGALCPSCWTHVRFIERPYCERLGTPFAQDLGPGLISPEAMASPPVYNRARAVARFEDGPARQMVHRLKYSDRMELARPMGLWMARAGAELLADAHLLISVPLHRRRMWSRKFNQAAALANAVSALSGVPSKPQLLRRVKDTASQISMSRAQRIENVQGAFKVLDEDRIWLDGRNVILVDDVLTSGATVNAAARALFRGGAARVDVLVFARVVTGT